MAKSSTSTRRSRGRIERRKRQICILGFPYSTSSHCHAVENPLDYLLNITTFHNYMAKLCVLRNLNVSLSAVFRFRSNFPDPVPDPDPTLKSHKT